jgi:predicted PurR-regulated permease PerM
MTLKENSMKFVFSTRWLICLAIIVLSLIAVYMVFQVGPYFSPLWNMIRTVAVPIVISMILAYLLHPLVDGLMKCKLHRTLAILVIYIFFLGGLTVLIWFAAPLLITQIKDLIKQLPEMESSLRQWAQILDQQLSYLPDGVHKGIDDALGNFEQTIMKGIMGVVHTLGSLLGNLFTLIVVPFLVFYLLNDVEVIQKGLYFFIPHKQRKPALKLWKDIDHSLGEYVRGQIMVGFVIGVLAFIGYYLIGLPYPLFLAVIVAVTNIIPYFGPFIGAGPAVFVALITDPTLLLWVIIVNMIIQVMEGNVLAPWIVGRRLHIHPVFIIFALLIGAEVGGILGLILAVPFFVVLKVVVHNSVLHFRQYRKTVESD